MLKILMMIFCFFQYSFNVSNLQKKLNNIREKIYNKIYNRLYIKPIKNAECCNDYKNSQNDITYGKFFLYNNKYTEKFDSNDCLNHVFKNITDSLNCIKLIYYFYDKNANIFVFNFVSFFTEESNLEVKIFFSIVCADLKKNIGFKKYIMSCENCVMLDAFDNVLYDNLKIFTKFCLSIKKFEDLFVYFYENEKLIQKYKGLINEKYRVKINKTKPEDLLFLGNKICYNCIETIELYDKFSNFFIFVCSSIISVRDNIGYCMVSRVDKNFLLMEQILC